MGTNYLTPSDLKEQCPAGYAELERQNSIDPTQTPIDELTLWCDADGTFYLQDPADDGFANVALAWDGTCWG